jgi:hypothetical protein
MVLSGSYHDSFGMGDRCSGSASFYEKSCLFPGDKVLYTCPGNSVELIYGKHKVLQDESYSLATSPSVDYRKTLFVYGVGNHPTRAPARDRYGILNASAYREERWDDHYGTPSFWGSPHHFVWVPPHYKMSVGRADETNGRILQFLVDSARFFAEQGAHTLNTYSLTEASSQHLCRSCDPPDAFVDALRSCRYFATTSTRTAAACEPTVETWDGFHYGRDINIMKANLLLDLFGTKLQ